VDSELLGGSQVSRERRADEQQRAADETGLFLRETPAKNCATQPRVRGGPSRPRTPEGVSTVPLEANRPPTTGTAAGREKGGTRIRVGMRSSILGLPGATFSRQSAFPLWFCRPEPMARAGSKNRHADEQKKPEQDRSGGRTIDKDRSRTADRLGVLLNGEQNNQTRRVWGNFL